MRTFCRLRADRRIGFLVAILLILVIPKAMAAQQQPTPDIGGIYVIGQKYFLPSKIWKNGNGRFKLAVEKSGVDGVLIDLTWSDVAPSYRNYDWSLLDYMARAAIERGKKSEIAIITGSSTPAWVVADPPNGCGAQSATFDYIQSTKPGATCTPQVLPLPWDSRYLAALGDLLDRLSRHLQKKGYYPDLTMLRITGINPQHRAACARFAAALAGPRFSGPAEGCASSVRCPVTTRQRPPATLAARHAPVRCRGWYSRAETAWR
jgi:hypothetical protein